MTSPAPLEQASIEKIRKQIKRVLGVAIDFRFTIEDRELEIIGL